MRYSEIPLIFTLILFSQLTFGQYYDTGQDPAGLKWMQIKTGRFTVIYPEKYGSQGISFARSLDDAYSKLVLLYPERKFNIPVVIHNFTTQSNGYVAWAPRRMEIYPTPEQNSIPLDPQKQLAIHELTHVFQMESLNRGFSKGMSFLFGEQFTGIAASLLPLWFLEGDAVFAETFLSESGRGRSPSFQKQLKAIAVEKGSLYKYDKIVNSSYRDFVPDYYQSGYQMVTWAMTKYNTQIWNKVLDYTAKQPFTINPVNISLSRSAGLTKKKLFVKTFETLKTIWTKELTDNGALSYETINPPKKGKYINYYSPVFFGNEGIISIKTSLSAPPTFVLTDPSGKSEKRIHTPGQIYPWFISCAKGKIVWVETQYDPRWDNRNYSVIKIMDLKTKKTRRLSQKTRYLSAAVSPDGKTIVAVENTISNRNNLVFIESGTGSILKSVPAQANVYLQQPRWDESGEKITSIFLNEEGEGILSYSLKNNKWETLLASGRDDLQSAFLRNDSLFYISSHSGTDNIWLKTNNGKIQEITKSRFGTTDLFIKGNKILFSDYSSMGNDISSLSLSKIPINRNEKISSESFLINQVKIDKKPLENTENKKYIPEPYRKWQHLFKFHSWMPFYADIEQIKADPASVRPGISIMTQNALSTLTSTIGYEYSTEKKHVIHSRITWKGWYPVFETQLDYGNNPGISKTTDINNPSVIQPGVRFLNIVSLPLRFSSGRFSQYIQPSLTSDYRNDYIYIRETANYDYGQTILSGRIYISNYCQAALRDIYPKWAQTIDLNYSYAPFDKSIYGSSITFKSSAYFPGFFPNNGIKIRIEIEKLIPPIFYGNRISFPRGYKDIISKNLDLISIDYAMPLAYPDFNISSLLYIKRLRTNLFYDYANGTGNYILESQTDNLGNITYRYNLHNYKETFRSFGFELLSDFHLFRIPYMISAGVQSSWKNIHEKPSIKFLFNIDLYGMTIGRRP